MKCFGTNWDKTRIWSFWCVIRSRAGIGMAPICTCGTRPENAKARAPWQRRARIRQRGLALHLPGMGLDPLLLVPPCAGAQKQRGWLLERTRLIQTCDKGLPGMWLGKKHFKPGQARCCAGIAARRQLYSSIIDRTSTHWRWSWSALVNCWLAE